MTNYRMTNKDNREDHEGWRIRVYLHFLLCGVLFGCGCCEPKRLPIPEPITRQDAIERYNANVNAIQPFKAGIAEWETEFIDPDGKKRHYNESGNKIIYHPPSDEGARPRLYVEADGPAFTQDAWVVGSNETEYWMYSVLGEFGRWGKHEHYGKDCAAMMPIHPQVLLEFVGLLPLPNEPPYPLYKVRAETYIIEYIVLKHEGYSSKREIIIDRRTNQPREINAYNTDGLMILHSELKTFKPLAEAMLPTEIFISFPKEKSFLRLKLKRYMIDAKNRDALFIRPKIIPDIEDYQQIDKDCEHE